VKLESKALQQRPKAEGSEARPKKGGRRKTQGGKQRRRAKAKSTIKNLKFNNLK